jgi:hypothetical protein
MGPLTSQLHHLLQDQEKFAARGESLTFKVLTTSMDGSALRAACRPDPGDNVLKTRVMLGCWRLLTILNAGQGRHLHNSLVVGRDSYLEDGCSSIEVSRIRTNGACEAGAGIEARAQIVLVWRTVKVEMGGWGGCAKGKRIIGKLEC